MPIISSVDGHLEISIDNAPEVAVNLFSLLNERSITLIGQAFNNVSVVHNENDQKIRILAEFLELEFCWNGQFRSCILPSRETKFTIVTLQSYIFVRWALENGGLKLEIINGSMAPICGELKSLATTFDWQRVLNAFDILAYISSRNPLVCVNVRLDDIVADGKTLSAFEALLSKNNMRGTFESISPPLTSPIRFILYYTTLSVAEYIFAVFAKREIVKIEISNERHALYMNGCQIHRVFLFRSNTLDIGKIYEIEKVSLDDTTLSLGDITHQLVIE